MAKRNKLEVTKDILKLVQENHKIKPTPLLRKSKLSSNRFKEYYNELIKKRLIIKILENKNHYIKLTEKGTRFLERYKTIINFIEEFEL